MITFKHTLCVCVRVSLICFLEDEGRHHLQEQSFIMLVDIYLAFLAFFPSL